MYIDLHIKERNGGASESESENGKYNVFKYEMVHRMIRLVWCSSVHHDGLSIRRPGFKSRHEHQKIKSDS